ncbi:hypothetical protein [Desulforegula conservatrix]|uniref:hypothetical protein n=1 Tax=Desulforegula conservatrix TaxID=153026 RepID=UPI0003FD5877|nr:hypothetical protein [Desulforegula conservatrix]
MNVFLFLSEPARISRINEKQQAVKIHAVKVWPGIYSAETMPAANEKRTGINGLEIFILGDSLQLFS